MFEATQRRMIEWGQCDPAGIVFNPRYAEMFDAATANLLAAAMGASKAEVVARYGIVGIPLVAHSTRYSAPCSHGDAIEIISSVAEIGRTSFVVQHRVMRAGTCAVDSRETRVWVARRSTDPLDIGGVPLPAEVVDRLAARPLSATEMAAS